MATHAQADIVPGECTADLARAATIYSRLTEQAERCLEEAVESNGSGGCEYSAADMADRQLQHCSGLEVHLKELQLSDRGLVARGNQQLATALARFVLNLSRFEMEDRALSRWRAGQRSELYDLEEQSAK